MDDCLIIGAGVVGLSLAYELAGHGLRVRVIDRGDPETQASWAGVGIFPPAPRAPYAHPYEQLFALSTDLHRDWAQTLKAETGQDNGYRRCGAVYFARRADDQHALETTVDEWRRQKITVEDLSPERLADLEPALAEMAHSGRLRTACLVHDEAQIRNPRHLKALTAGCQRRGVTITSGAEVQGFDVAGGRIQSVRTTAGPISAEKVCLTTGAWSGQVLDQLGIRVVVKPIRGQIVLLKCQRPPLERIVYEGPRYLVPRDDGRVLVGTTLEDAGFDRRNTPEALEDLKQFAHDVAPALKNAEIERTWAGLRPGTGDGLPYLGRLPDLTNAFVAAGHYRSGLQLSPGTAVVIGRLIRGESPGLDLEPFRVDRG